MSDPRPEELIHAEVLMYNGKVDEAFEIVVNFENGSDLTPKDQLSALLLKGNIYSLKMQYDKVVEVGERAFFMSQELELVPESIEALLLRAQSSYSGDYNKALNLILEAEKLMNSHSDESPANYTKLKLNLTHIKSGIYTNKGNFNEALDLAIDSLTWGEKIKNNIVVANVLHLVGQIYLFKREHDIALEYVMKSLKLMEKLDFQIGIAQTLSILGNIYFLKGELNRALEFCKKSLEIEEISNFTKVISLSFIGFIYREKGELDKALKYTKQSNRLAEEINYYVFLILGKRNIGEIYRRKGENDLATEYLEQSLTLCEKEENRLLIWSVLPLFSLLLNNLDINSPVQAQNYIKRLENLSDHFENTIYKHAFPLGKALMLKMSDRMADEVKAAELLKKIVEDEILSLEFHILAIVSLCDLLLEELSMYNNPVIIDDINPLIIKLQNVSENQNSFSSLAEGKLLQAKLALIQMNIEGAKKFLTEAQRITELHGLQLLARKISHEHDILLEKLGEWDKLKKDDAPMAERIELASFDGVINRLQGKQAVDPPEILDEEPILLLIMDNSGGTYFNHSFVENWDYSDLFSSFMSAFNTFMDEIFSNSIDRIKVKENTILIHPVESFLVCYVIKGQSYPALQKLTRFTEAIRENTEIWKALNKSLKTNMMLELDKPPALKTVINEIFTQ